MGLYNSHYINGFSTVRASSVVIQTIDPLIFTSYTVDQTPSRLLHGISVFLAIHSLLQTEAEASRSEVRTTRRYSPRRLLSFIWNRL